MKVSEYSTTENYKYHLLRSFLKEGKKTLGAVKTYLSLRSLGFEVIDSMIEMGMISQTNESLIGNRFYLELTPQKKPSIYSAVLVDEISKVHTIPIDKCITMDDLLHFVCRYYRQKKEAVLGKRRFRNIIIARHVFCYIAYYKLDETVQNIGFFINKDHSTIIHARGAVRDLLDTDKQFASRYYKLEAIVIEKMI